MGEGGNESLFVHSFAFDMLCDILLVVADGETLADVGVSVCIELAVLVNDKSLVYTRFVIECRLDLFDCVFPICIKLKRTK